MYQYGNGTEHQNERMFFRAVEIFVVLSFLMWYGKKILRKPGLFILGIAFGTLAVWTCYLIPHHNIVFYPVALVSVLCLIFVGKSR